MVVSITGATGFIGRRLAEYHLKSGNEVRYLTRNDSNPIVGANVFIGNVNSAADQLTPFLTNIDAFYHCAGEVKNEASMHNTHVQGTANLLHVIEALQLQNQKTIHWIQLSSCGAYGHTSYPLYIARDVDENTQVNPSGKYECTKTEADNLIIAFAEKHDWFKYTIIRPTIVFGTGMRSTLIMRITSMIKKRLFFYIGNKNTVANFVHVDDVVNAMILSANQPNAYNQIFIVSNDCKLIDLVDTVAETFSIPKPRWIISEWFLRKFVDVVGRRVKLPISSAQINVMVRQTYYNNNKIRKALNWSPTDSVLIQFKQYVNAVFKSING
jgi:nucleoside-diphosphate-sugar epimerase